MPETPDLPRLPETLVQGAFDGRVFIAAARLMPEGCILGSLDPPLDFPVGIGLMTR